MDIKKTDTQTKLLLEEIDQDSKPDTSFDSDMRKQELRSHILDNDAKERTITWKQDNMKKVYWLSIACLLCVLGIILLDGFQGDDFVLPIQVMVAIIIGGVGNVLGLYLVVLYNLFPKGKRR
ncbi:MAG: hypothetical protein PVG30_09510 [Gammaproteobacteria bacterium]|jgi:hypothetical protein